MKVQQSTRKPKADRIVFFGPLKTFAKRRWSRFDGASHNPLVLFTQEIEDAPLPPPNWSRIVGKRQVELCHLCPAMEGEVWGESQLLSTHHFLWRVPFLVSWCCEQAELQNMGSQRPDTVYESLQWSPTLMAWCAVSRTELIRPYFWQRNCY